MTRPAQPALDAFLGLQIFDIPWEPTAKGRPRATRSGIVYTPAKTRHAEAAIRYLLGADGARLYPRDVPLEVTAIFHVRRPKSGKRTAVFPTTRPDVENYLKLLMDAGTGTLWLDDAQIACVKAWKTYAADDAPLSIHLEVQPLAMGKDAKGERSEAVG